MHIPRPVWGIKTRDRAPDDEYAQATLFRNSMTVVEQDHIVDAYTFELGKVDVLAVVDRMVTRLAFVDAELVCRVASGLGLPTPELPAADTDNDTDNDNADAGSDDGEDDGDDQPLIDASGGLVSSPALSIVTENTHPVSNRVVQVLAADGADLAGIRTCRDLVIDAGAVAHVIAPHKGAITGSGKRADELTVDRSFLTASSAEGDAIVVAHGAAAIVDPAVVTFVQSAYRHCKLVAAWGDGVEVLAAAGIPVDAPGVIVSEKATKTFGKKLLAAMTVHRRWERLAPHPTRATPEKGQ